MTDCRSLSNLCLSLAIIWFPDIMKRNFEHNQFVPEEKMRDAPSTFSSKTAWDQNTPKGAEFHEIDCSHRPGEFRSC
jgi:hypothetical protein